MESFKWGKQFETGIKSVDEQHRSLVSMINDFGKNIAENSVGEVYLFSTLQELSNYAQIHFENEEKIMRDMKLDNRHVHHHLEQHSDFVNEVSSLAESMNPDSSQDCKMLFDYLTHWLAYHILGEDINMARQINAVAQGMDATIAFETGEKGASRSTQPLLVALNGLFGMVSKRNKALAELNKTLERRVEERTADLLAANEALEKISITDHLTKLPNRRYAMAQLELLFEEVNNQQSNLSCLMIDADGFKNIKSGRVSYSDSKLHDVILSFAVARHWPDVYSNAVDPGWVPTKMGGRGAPGNLQEGCETQAWLAVSNDDEAKVSGHYFHHKKQKHHVPEAADKDVQEKFLKLCEELTGVRFPE